MPRVHSFAPIADSNARILILGSMPGEASLAAQQYYAHPRNAFWQIMGELLGMPADAPYAQRVQALKAARIALWDVLGSCERPGSLDSNIDGASLVLNDFEDFFRRHAKISRVFFNGSKAEQLFLKRVLPLSTGMPLECIRLPSTSPANASFSLQRKLEAWRVLKNRD